MVTCWRRWNMLCTEMQMLAWGLGLKGSQLTARSLKDTRRVLGIGREIQVYQGELVMACTIHRVIRSNAHAAHTPRGCGVLCDTSGNGVYQAIVLNLISVRLSPLRGAADARIHFYPHGGLRTSYSVKMF